MLILFFTLFIVLMGFAIIMPVLPFYAAHMGATSIHLGLLMASYSLMQFLFAPFWGNLSDRKGRKPVLMVGLAGYGVSFIILGFATALWMIYFSRILGGILSAAVLPSSFAYVGDTTSDKERGGGMGVMGAAMGSGMVCGPIVGGFLSIFKIFQPYDVPFFVAGGMAFVTMVFAYVFLREPKNKIEISTGRFSFTIDFNVPRILVFLYVLNFIVSFSMGNLQSTLAFFVRDKFGYGAFDVGVVFLFFGLVGFVLQGMLVGTIINHLGEGGVIKLGLAITAVGLALIVLSFDFLSLVIYNVIIAVGLAFLRPSIPSLISKRTKIYGAAMGAQTSFESLGRVIGPTVGGIIYLFNAAYPYFLGSITLVATLFASFVFLGGLQKPRSNRAPGKILHCNPKMFMKVKSYGYRVGNLFSEHSKP
jgi:MFS family permease